MHELALYGQIPSPRYEQVLNILAGVAAVKPQTAYERHLIYKPLRNPDEARVNKKFPNRPVKPQTVVYQHLVRELAEGDFGKESPAFSAKAEDGGVESAPWILRTQDVPEPETKNLVLRGTTETLMSSESLQHYADSSMYSFVAEYITEGHRFIHKDVVIHLHRILRFPAQAEPQSAPQTVLPPLDAFTLIDPSGAFVLEAAVRIDDRTKQSLVSAASEELMRFRDLMKGVVELKTPERLALDTRVR